MLNHFVFPFNYHYISKCVQKAIDRSRPQFIIHVLLTNVIYAMLHWALVHHQCIDVLFPEKVFISCPKLKVILYKSCVNSTEYTIVTIDPHLFTITMDMEGLFCQRRRCQKGSFHTITEPRRHLSVIWTHFIKGLGLMRFPLCFSVSDSDNAYGFVAFCRSRCSLRRRRRRRGSPSCWWRRRVWGGNADTLRRSGSNPCIRRTRCRSEMFFSVSFP